MKLSDLARDAAGLTGVALIAVGSGLIYLPAGFIVLGIMLLMGAWLGGRAS